MPQTRTQTCTDQHNKHRFIAFIESSKRMPKAAVAADDRVDQGEDELLLRYESMRGACQNARTELSTAIGMPIGTLDGVLSRARKRARSLEPVA